jgi:hypothetical protein
MTFVTVSSIPPLNCGQGARLAAFNARPFIVMWGERPPVHNLAAHRLTLVQPLRNRIQLGIVGSTIANITELVRKVRALMLAIILKQRLDCGVLGAPRALGHILAR